MGLAALVRHWTGPALIVAAAVLAAPLWCAATPAMPDWPAHLAGFWLIGGGHAPAYELNWTFVPNLASELFVPLLAPLTGLANAAKIFLTLAILLWVLGAGAVHRALYGRTGISPLLGCFFAANANFIWGFFNYYFAAGLALLVFAGWIASSGMRAGLRLALFALAVTVLYFCHIFAAAVLAAMIAAFEAGPALRAKNPALLKDGALRLVLVFLPAALAFLVLKPHGNGETAIAFNLLETLQDRFESLYLHGFDDPAYVLPILLLAGLAVLLLLRRASLHPAMLPVLAVLGLGALLAPEWAMGGWGVHLRLPAFFAITLFASAHIELPHPLRGALALAAAALLARHAIELTGTWRAYDREVAEWRAEIPTLPQGARLFTVLDSEAIGDTADQPYWHLAEYAIPARGAFTPLMFATIGQHVVEVRAPFRRFAAATAQQGSPPDISELDDLAHGLTDEDPDIQNVFPYLKFFQCHFDRALVIHLGGRQSPVPPSIRLLHSGRFFSLYKTVPDATCAHH